MHPLSIRPFQPDDASSTIELWRQCNLLVPHNNPHQDIERKLHHSPEGFLVGLVEQTLVSSCMVGYDGHRGWINYLAVAPAYQRRGYATQILKHAETLLHSWGCPKSNLQIRATNHQVAAFYQSLGYREDPVLSLGKRLETDRPYQV